MLYYSARGKDAIYAFLSPNRFKGTCSSSLRQRPMPASVVKKPRNKQPAKLHEINSLQKKRILTPQTDSLYNKTNSGKDGSYRLMRIRN